MVIKQDSRSVSSAASILYRTNFYIRQASFTFPCTPDHCKKIKMNSIPHSTGSGFQQGQASISQGSFSHPIRTPGSVSTNNTYLMPTSPSKRARMSKDSYKPKIARTCGQRPACLVNASVTYCGNNQIYAFGGFDQYTDEGFYLH